MPGRDRTGPSGSGPMTGRGLGPCGGRRAIRGRGLGRGFGRGLGRGRISDKDESQMIDEELQEIEREREYLKKRKENLNE